MKQQFEIITEPSQGRIWFMRGQYNSGFPWWLRWKSLPAMQETQVWFLGQEDSLEKEMATLSSILA